MGRATKGCGCAAAVLVIAAIAGGIGFWKFFWPRWKAQPPRPSGELQIHVLDVGPINGDAILIVSPTKTAVLIDAGDLGKEKVVLEALKRYEVQQLDYFIGTHSHPDHLGAAAAVFKATKVLNVIDNDLPPPAGLPSPSPTPVPGKAPKPTPKPTPRAAKRPKGPAQFFLDYKDAIKQSGAHYETATVGKKYDLGGGARLTILGPSQPYFTKDQMKAGGNEPNANSIVVRLDYGDFSMLLAGDAEEQTEQRMLAKELELKSTLLKVSHHGSKYATSEGWINRVQPEAAIISAGEWNRYGHPAQSVLDRLKAANAKVYRTDLQGEITITTTGKLKGDKLFDIKTAKEAKSDVWEGRQPQKDDASRSGFIAYGDFGPPPKVKPEKPR